MDGENGTVGDRIMKDLGKELNRTLRREARDLGVSWYRYGNAWHAMRAMQTAVLGYEPSSRLTIDAIRASMDVTRAADHCRLYEQEYHTEARIEAKQIVNSEGIEATSMEILSKEAKWPLLQSLLRQLEVLLELVRMAPRLRHATAYI